MAVTKDVFLIGAGFSKIFNPKMPLMIELGKDLLKKCQIKKEFLPKDFLATGNAEVLLSYLSESFPWEDEAKALEKKATFIEVSKMIGNIIQELQNEKVVFDQLTINYFEKAINSCAVFLTLNYDLVLEELLLSTRSSNNFLMKSFYPIPLTSAFARGGAGGWYASRAENQPYIYKLHGSINWYYSGMQSFYGEQIYFADIGDKSKKVERDMDYELIEDKVPLIIPPTFSKSHYFNSETIKLMWKKAESEIKKAKRLICIGYSFPTSDTVLKQLIQSSLSDDCEVIIVNPDKNVSFRIREVLEKNRIFQFDDHPHISFFKKELASDS